MVHYGHSHGNDTIDKLCLVGELGPNRYNTRTYALYILLRYSTIKTSFIAANIISTACPSFEGSLNSILIQLSFQAMKQQLNKISSRRIRS